MMGRRGISRIWVACAVAGLLAGCAVKPEGSLSFQVSQKVDRVFGSVDLSRNKELSRAYDADGRGFSMFRGYSELPFPDRFSTRAPEAYNLTLVTDFALDFTEVDGFPLYRIGVRPRKMPLEDVRAWPDYITVNTAPLEGRPSRLVARLPQNRSLDQNGFLWSEMTYCSECFELSRIHTAVERSDVEAFELMDRGLSAAAAKSGSATGFEGLVRLIDFAQEGVVVGEEAKRFAPMGHAEVVKAKSGLNGIKPARDAYLSFATAYLKDTTPVRALQAQCGAYQTPSASKVTTPNDERERMEGYADCYARELSKFDQVERKIEISARVSQEVELARAGAIAPQNRIQIKTPEGEMMSAYAYIRQVQSAFVGWSEEQSKSAFVKTMPNPEPEQAAAPQAAAAAPVAPVVATPAPAAPVPAVIVPIVDDAPLCFVGPLCDAAAAQ